MAASGEPRRVHTLNRQRSRWLATALVGVGVLTVPIVGNAEVPAISRRRRRRDHRRRHVRRRPARAHRSGAQHDARRLPGHQRDVRRAHRHRRHRSGEHRDRAARRRVVRVQRGRHGVDVQIQEGMAVLRRRADPAEHVPALVGAGRRSDSPATTATCSTSSRAAPRRSTAGEADTLRRRRRRRGDDAHGHAGGAVRQLPRRRRVPAVLPDARGRRRDPATTTRTS